MKNQHKSPFTFGNTVSGKAFTDRKEDKKRLRNNLSNGINTIIISPRRWGKSSLVEEVFKQIDRDKKYKIVNIDLFSVADEAEFLEKFAREIIKASSSKWEEWIINTKSFFKALIPTISIGNDPYTDFSLSFDINELPKHADEILNLPEIIAQKKGIEFIIGLDEFQNLSQFPKYTDFEKKMRAVWQRQKKVTYCLYGSKRHMMTDIFSNSAKAFYRFGDILMMQKIPTNEWVKFIIKKFKETRKEINKEQATKIVMLMERHSWYVQQLSHYVWVKTIHKVNENIMQNALEEIVVTSKPMFINEIDRLSQTQVNLLKAIVEGETQLTSVRVMKKYKLGTPRNVSKNKQNLRQNDIIDIHTDKTISFLDPVFKYWFVNYYINK